MGGCRKNSGQIAFVPSSPVAIDHVYVAPGVPVDIVFDSACDQAFVPALASFEIIVDGVPELPTLIAWQDAYTLRFNFGGVPTATGVWRYIHKDVNLRGVNGSVSKPVQTQVFHP